MNMKMDSKESMEPYVENWMHLSHMLGYPSYQTWDPVLALDVSLGIHLQNCWIVDCTGFISQADTLLWRRTIKVDQFLSCHCQCMIKFWKANFVLKGPMCFNLIAWGFWKYYFLINYFFEMQLNWMTLAKTYFLRTILKIGLHCLFFVAMLWTYYFSLRTKRHYFFAQQFQYFYFTFTLNSF